MSEIRRCDQCRVEVPADQFSAAWLTVELDMPRYAEQAKWDFCSKRCLAIHFAKEGGSQFNVQLHGDDDIAQAMQDAANAFAKGY